MTEQLVLRNSWRLFVDIGNCRCEMRYHENDLGERRIKRLHTKTVGFLHTGWRKLNHFLQKITLQIILVFNGEGIIKNETNYIR